MENPNEQDLELLIEEKLKDCKSYHNICELVATEVGKQRVVDRVKEILYSDGIDNIDTALAQIETDLMFLE